MMGLINFLVISNYDINQPFEMIDYCGTPWDITGLVSKACGKVVQGGCESVHSKWRHAASHGPMEGKPARHRSKHIPSCSEPTTLWQQPANYIYICFPLTSVSDSAVVCIHSLGIHYRSFRVQLPALAEIDHLQVSEATGIQQKRNVEEEYNLQNFLLSTFHF